MEREISSKKIIFSLILFIVFWTIITDAWGYSDFIFNNSANNIGIYIYGYVSRILWVIPAIYLIVKYNYNLSIDKKRLLSYPKVDKTLVVVLLLSICYVTVSMFLVHKGFFFDDSELLGLVIIKYMLVGFVEEMVFRGWGYNALVKNTTHIKATFITTVLFVILHWPAYFIKLFRFGFFDFAGIIGQSSAALFWGIVFCWLLKKGKSVWNPILAHALYDLSYVLLVG